MYIKDLLDKYTGDFAKLVTALSVDSQDRDVETYRKEYNGEHDILDRPVKVVGTGRAKKNVPQAKEVIRYQKKIVQMAVAFLFGDPAKLILSNEGDKFQEAFDLLKDVWVGNKLDYFNRKLARKLFVETKVAELWYVVVDEDKAKHIKVSLLSDENGDGIYPHFNENGDMDAFTRRYSITELDGKDYEHVDIYMADKIIYAVKRQEWITEEKENLYGKIPVVYYEQAEPEWTGVQSEIDRSEMLISKFADTNDYFGAPTIKLKGKLVNPPEKGEVGRMLRFSPETGSDGKVSYGDATYLTWEHAPESIKLEFEILKDIIYSMTSTPDLSFNNVKGLTKTSGEALKFLFMDSILKAMDKEEIFGEGLTRRVNLLKAILSVTSVKDKDSLQELDISVKFGKVLPQDVTETIKALSMARGGEPLMSEKSAVRQNPYVDNSEEEIENLEGERGKVNKLGESFEV